MVPFSREIRSEEAYVPATTKVRRALFLAVQEVLQISHFFFYSILLYFNRLV